jgi:hypothetical protein
LKGEIIKELPELWVLLRINEVQRQTAYELEKHTFLWEEGRKRRGDDDNKGKVMATTNI